MVLAVNKLDLIKDYEETGQELEFYMKQQYLDKFAEEHGYWFALLTQLSKMSLTTPI